MTTPALEPLEQRLAPYVLAVGWAVPSQLTFSLAGSPGEDERRLALDAFRRWAEVAPLHFVELPDSGPPGMAPYDAAGRPMVRVHFGQSLFFGIAGQAFFPGAEGLSGDVFLARPATAAVVTHEIGHALGLSHSDVSPSIMTAVLSSSDPSLRPDDVAGVQALYGAGVGSVTPLREAAPPYDPFPGFQGRTLLVSADADGDGSPDRVWIAQGEQGHVKADDDGREVASFLAFPGFLGEVRAAGGESLAVAALLPEGGAHLKAYVGGREVVSLLVERGEP